jgi:hypothetical protein
MLSGMGIFLWVPNERSNTYTIYHKLLLICLLHFGCYKGLLGNTEKTIFYNTIVYECHNTTMVYFYISSSICRYNILIVA